MGNRRRITALSVIVAGLGYAIAAGATSPRRPERMVTRVAARATTPPGYFYAVRGWHTPDASRTVLHDASGRPMFVVHAMVLNERVVLSPSTPNGGFSATDVARVTHAVRESSTGHEFPINPHLLDVIYQIQTHFNAQEIRVLSAYRTPKPGNSQGNHGRGRAMDFIVPGTSDADVGRFARERGFVGVGVYPNAGFVHVDVRERSYFWLDASGPGLPSRERGILPDVAARADALARTRGERPPPPFVANGLPERDEDEDL